MKKLNEKATEVMRKLVKATHKREEGYAKIDSKKGFMPVIVERIGEIEGQGNIISVAHYGKLNGDAMRDPDMTFVVKDDDFFPITFRNDYLGVDQEVFSDNGNWCVSGINEELQSELTDFANDWMNNIKNQQEL